MKEFRTVTIALYPGFGKTFMGAMLTWKLNYKTCVLVHRDNVGKQWVKTFKNYFDIDIEINEINSDNSVNRTLNTENIEFNNLLWMNAGYDHVTTIEENIKELAESDI